MDISKIKIDMENRMCNWPETLPELREVLRSHLYIFSLYLCMSLLIAPVFYNDNMRLSIFHSMMAFIFCFLWAIQIIYRYVLFKLMERRGDKVNKTWAAAFEEIEFENMEISVDKCDGAVTDLKVYIRISGETDYKEVPISDELKTKLADVMNYASLDDLVKNVVDSYKYSLELEYWIAFLGVLILISMV